MGYEFPGGIFRAQCSRVVDGDTVDLYVDAGFHNFHRGRFRIFGIDTHELNSKDPVERAKALEAKIKMIEWLRPPSDPLVVSAEWSLQVTVRKDPDSFGRWLATIGTEQVTNVGDELIRLGLAVPYVR